MPVALSLPHISALSFANSLASESHPALPFRVTVARDILRSTLDEYHQEVNERKSSRLNSVKSAIDDYLPLLDALRRGLDSGCTAYGEHVNVILTGEVDVRWRSSIVPSRIAGKRPPKLEANGIDAEVVLTLSTLAATSYLAAKEQLRSLFDLHLRGDSLTIQLRTAKIASATDSLLLANSVYNGAVSFISANPYIELPTEISHAALSCLADLTIAEASLLAIAKDDPYPGLVAAQRNKNDIDWMIGAPKIPKVRAHLFARICVAAANHADHGTATVKSSKFPANIDEIVGATLQSYLESVRCVARAKACRFAGIDAEADGATGRAIGWLHAALLQLRSKGSSLNYSGDPIKPESNEGVRAKLQKRRVEKREDKLIEQYGDWGRDAGRAEELQIVEMLLAKWKRLNDTVDFQPLANARELVKSLPSGREFHSVRPWARPSLDEQILASMRAPLDPSEERRIAASEQQLDSEDDDIGNNSSEAPAMSYY